MGIRRSEEMNRAMLKKPARRLINEEEGTWCKVLRSKYGLHNRGPIEFKKQQHPSFIWKALCWCSDFLRSGLRWTISDGKRVFFWKDNWLQGGPLIHRCVQHPGEEEATKRVCDYWIPGVVWDWPAFTEFLQATDLLLIASSALAEEGSGVDKFGWLKMDGGRFSVRSAFDVQQRRIVEQVWKGWRVIWRLKAQKRAQVFIWIMAHDKILTNFSRWRRKMAMTPTCFLCGDAAEDTLHAIRDCRAAKEVWLRFFSTTPVSRFLLHRVKRVTRT